MFFGKGKKIALSFAPPFFKRVAAHAQDDAGADLFGSAPTEGLPEAYVLPPRKWSAAAPDLTTASLQSHLDHCTAARIAGWACYAEHIETTVTVQIYFDGVLVQNIQADNPRPDVKKAGFGNGLSGFAFVPAKEQFEAASVIEVRAQSGQRIGKREQSPARS